jgi:hypothetical protein
MPNNWNAVAQAAYETYAQIVRAEAQTLPVPEWEELPPRYQEGWREAVKEACGLKPHASEE